MSLAFFNINNETRRLVATVKTRVQGYYENVKGVTIHFYQDAESPENLIGDAVTNDKGIATIDLPEKRETPLWTTYVATLKDALPYADADRDVTIKKAVMELTTEEKDSVKTVKVFVGSPDSTGNIIPAEGVTVGIFVRRLFGLLPITKDFTATDAEGNLVIAFPPGIPGDENGNLTIVAQVNDHDDFGNLEASKQLRWGEATVFDRSAQLKELWLSSANTSRVILTLTTLMLIGVLGVVLFIIQQLSRISKLGLR